MCGAEALANDVYRVRPRIGGHGTTVEVVLQGKFLSDPRDLVFINYRQLTLDELVI